MFIFLHLEKPSNDIHPICLMLDEGSNFCKIKDKLFFLYLLTFSLRSSVALIKVLNISIGHPIPPFIWQCSHLPCGPHLYNAENLIIAQMFSLTVDQEVVELRDAQSQNPQWCVFYSRPVGHNAGCCNGVWDLLLVVRHLLPRSDKQTKIRTIARQ